MESRDMSAAELKRLLKQELLTEEHARERDEIEQLLKRSDPSEQNTPRSTMKEINLSELFALKRAQQEQQQQQQQQQQPQQPPQQPVPKPAPAPTPAPTPKQNPQTTAAPVPKQVPTPEQTAPPVESVPKKTPFEQSISRQMQETPHTRGKYEKTPATEEALNPVAQLKHAEVPKTRGKYEKVTDGEVDFPQKQVRMSAAERRRRSKRNMMMIRIIIGAACLFLVGLVAGLIVNTMHMKEKNQTIGEPNTPAAAIQSNVTEENTAPTTEPAAEPETQAETVKSSGNSNILSITPLNSFHAVPAGKTITLQISMTTKGSASAADLNWTSSDESIATVSDKGVVTGIAGGSCNIIVAAKDDDAIRAEIPCIVRTIEEKDGVTYIDGIMLINKTYGAPASFNPGMEAICEEAFRQLSEDAAELGLDIYNASGYREFGYQDTIYNNYAEIYGYEMADTFSARPGHSEHQTGLVIDVNTIDDAFGSTPEAAWLAEHCADYGFIIRFPEDKVDITGYKYEPWHIRYVGKEVAQEINALGLCLEEYLGVDSVYQENWDEDSHY